MRTAVAIVFISCTMAFAAGTTQKCVEVPEEIVNAFVAAISSLLGWLARKFFGKK
jgi:hypothetical protein